MILPNSVGSTLTRFKDDPETATVLSALRIVYPDTEGLSYRERISRFNQVPLTELSAKLAADRTGWAPPVLDELKVRGLTSHTYTKHYPGAIRRLVERGFATSQSEELREKVLAEWKLMQESMDTLFPGEAERMRRLLAAGITSFGTYRIADQTFSQLVKRIQNTRSRFNCLAKQCSAQGLRPRDFAAEVLATQNFSRIPMLMKSHARPYYDAQNVWNAILDADPSLDLPRWGDRRVIISLPKEAYPDQLIEGYQEALFEGRSRSLNTVENYWGTYYTYLGVLESEGIPLLRLTSGLGPKDALRLISQGFPRELLTHDPDKDAPRALALRIVEDRAFRDQVISHMRMFEGAYDGLESKNNPFVDIALEVRREQGKYSANRQLVMRISFINKEYLAIRDRHYVWIKSLLDSVGTAEEKHETVYDDKKQIAFQHPRTWEGLWQALQEQIPDLLEGATNPTAKWADEVGKLTLFYMMLLYPMRREQFNMMLLHPIRQGEYAPALLLKEHAQVLESKDLKANFNPETYEISFSKAEVKNRLPINYTIPERGGGNLCRELIAVYIKVARPLRLKGRSSPYMFVPEQRKVSGLHLRKAALNDMLPEICKAHFKDVLPRELLNMNPHLMRHIAASYALVVKTSLSLAAMLLNDKPETVLSHYSDVLQCSRDELKSFYENDVNLR